MVLFRGQVTPRLQGAMMNRGGQASISDGGSVRGGFSRGSFSAGVTQVSRDGGHAGQMDRHLVRKRGVRQTGPFEELLVSAYNL